LEVVEAGVDTVEVEEAMVAKAVAAVILVGATVARAVAVAMVEEGMVVGDTVARAVAATSRAAMAAAVLVVVATEAASVVKVVSSTEGIHRCRQDRSLSVVLT